MTLVDVEHPPPAAPAPKGEWTADVPPLRRAPRRGRRHPLWWLTPAGSVLLVVPLSLSVAVNIPDADYRYFYGAPLAITSADVALFAGGAAMVVLGSVLPLAVARPRVPDGWPAVPVGQHRVLVRAEPIVFWLTVAGYLALGGLGLARGATPGALLGAITSQSNYTDQLKTQFAPVAGVSSFTQVGIAYVVVAGVLLCHDDGGRRNRLVRRVAIVVALGLLRSFLLSERLALLELLVPLVAIAAARLHARARRVGWLGLFPVLALPVLAVIFGAFEYSRSWVYFRTRTSLPFPEFVVNRLAGYYATSYNNGALQLAQPAPPGRLPYDSIQAFWTAPGVAQANLYERLTGQQGGDLLNTVLSQQASPEFNNPGGLAVPFIDFGVVGGMLYFLVAGVLIGLAYRGFRAGSTVGLLTYPVLFTGLLELPRYVYWTQGRAFPALVFLLVTALVMRRRRA